jgi:hypothetical protein
MPRFASCALAAVLLVGCDRDAPPPSADRAEPPVSSSEPAPRVELLLEAGDSTYWLRSGPDGVRLRGSPILLARLDGRYHELYVVDDDHSFYDAVFIGQRLWRRDLITGDSIALVSDSLIHAAARRWARRHPDAAPLAPDEDESESPGTVATGEIEVLDVLGPWVTIQRSIDVDVDGEPHFHSRRREVVDLRTGRAATLHEVLGAEGARTAVDAARSRYAIALDSVRQARDERGRRAALALASFPFDSTSFGLAARDGSPVLTFFVPGHGEDGGGRVLELPPVNVAPPSWWREVAAMLPRQIADSVDRWQLGSLALDALWQGDTTVRLVVRDSAGGRWIAGHVPPPPRWLVRLDVPPLDSAARRALARAFDESALYSDDVRTVARPAPPRWRRGPRHLPRT